MNQYEDYEHWQTGEEHEHATEEEIAEAAAAEAEAQAQSEAWEKLTPEERERLRAEQPVSPEDLPF